MIHVIATVTVNPGTRDRFLEVFNGNVPNVLAEDGCIEYGAAVDVQTEHRAQGPVRPDVVVVLEKWRDVAALMAHSLAPHMKTYRIAVNDCIQSVSLQILSPA